MNRTTTGTIQSVQGTTLGSVLDADALISATSITVDDATDFDAESGGTLSIAGTLYTYTVTDADAGTITISPGLAAAAADGDRVDVWNVAQNAAAVEYRALVRLPGDVDNADSLDAAISLPLATLLPEGMRDEGEGEVVTLEQRDDEWVAVDAPGIAPQIQMASFPTTITDWNDIKAPGEYLSVEGSSANSPDDSVSWAGSVHGRGTPGVFPIGHGTGVAQVLLRVDAGVSRHSSPPQMWMRYADLDGAWTPWWQVTGRTTGVSTGIFTAGTGVTILSQYGFIEGAWANVYCAYSVGPGAGTPIVPAADGDISNVTVLNIAAAYQSTMGFPTWGLSSAGIGRTATHIVSGTTIKLASVAGSANIVSGDSFSFSGRYPLSG